MHSIDAIVDAALAVCTPQNRLVVQVTLKNRRPRPPCWETPLPNPVMTATVTYTPTHTKVVIDDEPPAMHPVSFDAAALADAYGLDLDAVQVTDFCGDSVCIFKA